MDLGEELKERGLVQETSADVAKILGTKRTVYLGIDPTADSLHVGHLVPVLLMTRLAHKGHKLIFLVGGGTGMIGDPKEKGERVLLDDRTVKTNTKALKLQLKQVLQGTKFSMVDNADWLLKVGLVPFLRDIGKHFTVNDLIKRDLIKKRLETADESISYTEFTYALLQGYDYLMLHQKYGCDLQIGASDQWTNILSGVELIRKKTGHESYALTVPLITDATGKKFGKSEGNAVWLDPKKTSPFVFYQFWLSSADANVEHYLKAFTFMPLNEISALVELHRRNPERRQAQRILAREVTELVHGKKEAHQAERFTEVLFGNASFESLTPAERVALMNAVPSVALTAAELMQGMPLTEALTRTPFIPSKSEARRLIEAKGIRLNGTLVEADRALTEEDFHNGLAIMQKGKSERLLLSLTRN